MRQVVLFRPNFGRLSEGEVKIVKRIATDAGDNVPQMFMVQYVGSQDRPVLAFEDELVKVETQAGSWDEWLHQLTEKSP